MITVACPFINKGLRTHEVWLHNFKRVRMPRKEMKLLFIDMAKDDIITEFFKNYLREFGKDWKEVEYVKDPLKTQPNIDDSPTKQDTYRFVLKRKTVSETMGIMNKQRVGNTVIFEDDIVAPENAFERMYPLLKGDVWAVAGCQYARVKSWNAGKALIAWNIKDNKPVVIKSEDEKSEGEEAVGATATGFHIYNSDFLDQHDFPCSEELGQDILAGLAINKAGKKVLLCWDMKFPHLKDLGTKDGVIFRSDLCKTPVYDVDGKDLMLDPRYIYIPPKEKKVFRKSSPQFIYETRLH